LHWGDDPSETGRWYYDPEAFSLPEDT